MDFEELKLAIALNKRGNVEIISVEPMKILEIISEENPLMVKYKYIDNSLISNYTIFNRTVKSFKKYFNLFYT